MIIVKTYRGHIRNWEELCERLGIDLTLSREEREHEILIKAYQTWGCEMADHMHGMFAFALWDEEEQKLFCLRDQFGTKPFYYYGGTNHGLQKNAGSVRMAVTLSVSV